MERTIHANSHTPKTQTHAAAILIYHPHTHLVAILTHAQLNFWALFIAS